MNKITGKYTSPDIQNELLSLSALQLQNNFSDEIRKAGWFSILLDEGKDISKKEQL